MADRYQILRQARLLQYMDKFAQYGFMRRASHSIAFMLCNERAARILDRERTIAANTLSRTRGDG
jgi:hypothetical protein